MIDLIRIQVQRRWLFPRAVSARLCLFAMILAAQPELVLGQSPDLFVTVVQPYVQKYCVVCHSRDDAKGELDLTRYSKSSDVIASFRRWNNVVEFIRNGEMPPKDAQQPSLQESADLVSTVQAILIAEAAE